MRAASGRQSFAGVLAGASTRAVNGSTATAAAAIASPPAQRARPLRAPSSAGSSNAAMQTAAGSASSVFTRCGASDRVSAPVWRHHRRGDRRHEHDAALRPLAGDAQRPRGQQRRDQQDAQQEGDAVEQAPVGSVRERRVAVAGGDRARDQPVELEEAAEAPVRGVVGADRDARRAARRPRAQPSARRTRRWPTVSVTTSRIDRIPTTSRPPIRFSWATRQRTPQATPRATAFGMLAPPRHGRERHRQQEDARVAQRVRPAPEAVERAVRRDRERLQGREDDDRRQRGHRRDERAHAHRQRADEDRRRQPLEEQRDLAEAVDAHVAGDAGVAHVHQLRQRPVLHGGGVDVRDRAGAHGLDAAERERLVVVDRSARHVPGRREEVRGDGGAADQRDRGPPPRPFRACSVSATDTAGRCTTAEAVASASATPAVAIRNSEVSQRRSRKPKWFQASVVGCVRAARK